MIFAFDCVAAVNAGGDAVPDQALTNRVLQQPNIVVAPQVPVVQQNGQAAQPGVAGNGFAQAINPHVPRGRVAPSNGQVLPQHDIERINQMVEQGITARRRSLDILNEVGRAYPHTAFDFEFRVEHDYWEGRGLVPWNERGDI